MSNKETTFTDWLDALESKNGLSDYEVAKKGGFSHSVLSRARSGIPPKWDVCLKIANVFNVSPITAMRKAGLLPDGGDLVSFDDWQHVITQLTPEEEEEIRNIAETKISRRQKSEQAERAKNFKPKKV